MVCDKWYQFFMQGDRHNPSSPRPEKIFCEKVIPYKSIFFFGVYIRLPDRLCRPIYFVWQSLSALLSSLYICGSLWGFSRICVYIITIINNSFVIRDESNFGRLFGQTAFKNFDTKTIRNVCSRRRCQYAIRFELQRSNVTSSYIRFYICTVEIAFATDGNTQ
jgi:hypothetical protein